MVFKYKWVKKESGNYAIRKRATNKIEAGKELEPIYKSQTSDTHFFLWVDKEDTENMYNLYKVNSILKTIKYEYRYLGSDKKSGTPYLTKSDIENVFNNIEQYKTKKVVNIETPLSKVANIETQKSNKTLYRDFEKKLCAIMDDNENLYNKLLELLKINLRNDNELKRKRLETKKLIRKLNNDLSQFELTTNAEKIKSEKFVFKIMKSRIKNLEYDTGNNNFVDYLNKLLYPMAKTRLSMDGQKERQERYRDRKNAKEGKPKQKAGRPRTIK
jgi:hypothetical protein